MPAPVITPACPRGGYMISAAIRFGSSPIRSAILDNDRLGASQIVRHHRLPPNARFIRPEQREGVASCTMAGTTREIRAGAS